MVTRADSWSWIEFAFACKPRTLHGSLDPLTLLLRLRNGSSFWLKRVSINEEEDIRFKSLINIRTLTVVKDKSCTATN